MKCNACGQDVPAESAFCPKCGARLGDDGGDDDGSDNGASTPAQRFTTAGSRGSGKQPPEEDLWSGTYSPQAMVGPAAGVAVLTVIGLVAGSFAGPVGLTIAAIGSALLWGLLGLALLYRRMTVRYRLTTYRLFHETGLLSRTRDRIEVIDITDVRLQQGIIERLFNVGTIEILSSDKTHGDLRLKGIDDVRVVTDLIDNTRRAERQRRGVFMENIGGLPGPV